MTIKEYLSFFPAEKHSQMRKVLKSYIRMQRKKTKKELISECYYFWTETKATIEKALDKTSAE